jgi:hypothetical protein
VYIGVTYGPVRPLLPKDKSFTVTTIAAKFLEPTPKFDTIQPHFDFLFQHFSPKVDLH